MSYGVMSLPAANVMRTRRVRLTALSVTCGDTSPKGRGYAGDGLTEESWGVMSYGVMSLPAANVMRTRRVRLTALSVTCGDTSPGGRGYSLSQPAG